jgi:hypothetical protein
MLKNIISIEQTAMKRKGYVANISPSVKIQRSRHSGQFSLRAAKEN